MGAAELAAAKVTLLRAVREAGALMLEGAGELRVEAKGPTDIVTDVDRRCEALVAALIRGAHPGHALLAEEGTQVSGGSGGLWLLDPLDGTKNYAHGLPRYACSLAFTWGGATVLGAVYNPSTAELFVAEQGGGATLNGATLRVSATVELASALVGSALTVQRRYVPEHFARLAALTSASQGVRVQGCAALDLCDVARGRLEAYLEEGLDPWDTAAGALIVREAGGAVTTFSGLPHDPFGAQTLASNGPIGEALVALLAVGAG